MDLFARSFENKARLEDAFHSRFGENPAPAFEEFLCEVSNNGRVSMNMRPCIAADLLHRDQYKNMYEAVAEEAALTGRETREILRQRLGKYFEKRIRFDAVFSEGRSFKYGALNIGGVGATRYGSFCVVLKPSFPDRVAYLKQDSLNRYADEHGNFDEEAFQSDLACHSHRQLLAALKHAHEIESRKDNWSTMLCCDSEYIEAIFVGAVNKSTVDEVRVSASEHRTLWDLCFDAHARKLSNAEHALAHDFRQILLCARDDGIRLLEVCDA